MIKHLLYLIKYKIGINQLLINQGIILSDLNNKKNLTNLDEASFKVFSQWGEDGIIQYLINNLKIKEKTFIEFGVEDFHESNCRYLMEKDNWSGFVIDGSRKNNKQTKKSYFYWQYNLKAVNKFITKENISFILESSGFKKNKLGILSIDLDGIDWYILNEIFDWEPAIFIVEYNSIFGNKPWTVPYEKNFVRGKSHESNVFYGAGLRSFEDTLNKRGYKLVGVNKQRSNAFFINESLVNDKINELRIPVDIFDCKFRESRNKKGKLNFKNLKNNKSSLKGSMVFNTILKKEEKFY